MCFLGKNDKKKPVPEQTISEDEDSEGEEEEDEDSKSEEAKGDGKRKKKEESDLEESKENVNVIYEGNESKGDGIELDIIGADVNVAHHRDRELDNAATANSFMQTNRALQKY